jgi:hypothetical protein
LHSILFILYFQYSWFGNIALSGSGSIIIKPINGEQSSCRDKGRSASNFVRDSASKTQGNFHLAAKRCMRSIQRAWSLWRNAWTYQLRTP